MTIPAFVNLLLQRGGVVQFRDPDKITIDYTLQKKNKESYICKTIWSGIIHNIESEEKISFEDAVNEIINKVTKK